MGNTSECDLALIPPLYPLNLNNGGRANLPSVAVNPRVHSTEFNRAVGNLARKSGEGLSAARSIILLRRFDLPETRKEGYRFIADALGHDTIAALILP